MNRPTFPVQLLLERLFLVLEFKRKNTMCKWYGTDHLYDDGIVWVIDGCILAEVNRTHTFTILYGPSI